MSAVRFSESARCSCGDPRRPQINHRKRIPCWTYIGTTRHEVVNDRESPFGFRLVQATA